MNTLKKPWLPYDVSRCDGGKCPVKESCLRFLAVGAPFNQSWISSKDIKPEWNGCGLYISQPSLNQSGNK